MPSPDAPPPFAELREKFRKLVAEERLPSLAVGVARDGEIQWEEAFGWADREARLPATPHTMYSLASISKPITATGLMVLAEQGKVDLDAPINDYLGDAKIAGRAGDAAGATVRRVANHTAGLPLQCHFFYEDEERRRPPMDETIRRYCNLVSAPGERYYYANLGYGLMDYVISRLSGRSYAEFMKREVFLPLGMTRASVGIGPGLQRYAAERYGGDGVAYPYYTFDHPGASEVYASVHDLLRFAMLHMKTPLPDQKAILTDETLDEMHRQTSEPEGEEGYGVGWRTGRIHGYRVTGHSGGMSGVSTTLHILPDEKIAVAVLCNRHHYQVYDLFHEILAALLPDYAERRAEEERKKADAAPEEKEPDAPFAPPDALKGEWTGTVHTYAGDFPLVLTFREDGDVHARLDDGLTSLVNHVRHHDGWLAGDFLGTLETEDATAHPHHLGLDLRLRGDALNGALVVRPSNRHEGGAPGRRLGNALSYWTELKKAEG